MRAVLVPSELGPDVIDVGITIGVTELGIFILLLPVSRLIAAALVSELIRDVSAPAPPMAARKPLLTPERATSAVRLCRAVKLIAAAVSYTHLTLPTKRIV